MNEIPDTPPAPEGQPARTWSVRRVGKLAAIALVLTLGYLFVHFYLARVVLEVPKAVFWRAALGFLLVFEGSYLVVLAACLVGIPALALRLRDGRRRGVRRPLTARGLLLCLSLAISMAVSEATVAALRSRLRLTTAVPAGARPQGQADAGKMPHPPDEVALPETFEEVSARDEVNLVVLGESSALGFPYNSWTSVGHMVAWKLKEAMPEKTFRLDMIAVSGETLEAQHRRLAGLRRRPDVLLIYCGHNEFSARFPWSRDLDYYADALKPSPWRRIIGRLEGISPLCGLIRESADKCRIAIPPPPNGHRALVDAPAYTPSEYAALLADFRRRIDTLVAYAERVGAIPILVVPPANDSGFEPNRSFLPRDTPRADREAFARAFSDARALEAGAPQEALRRYRSLLERQPGFAELHYRLARMLEQAGLWDEAYGHDVAARDLDGLPLRCPTAFQEVYRDVARRRACILVDGQAVLRTIAPHGLLDDHLFQDTMHPSLRGFIGIAQAVLAELHARRAFGWPKTQPLTQIDPALCAQHFGLNSSAWSTICGSGMTFYGLVAGIRYDPAERRRKAAAFGQAQHAILGRRSPQEVGLPNIGIPESVPLVPLPVPKALSQSS